MLISTINKFRTTLYVQIWEKRIKVSDIESKKIFDEQPLVAIESDKKGKKTIAAIGNNASSLALKDNTVVINPFSHPRDLFSNLEVAEKLLQHIIRTLNEKKYFVPSPVLVIHPMEKTEGGLTMIEKRVFRELAFGAGARNVVLYQGKELSIYDFDFDAIKTADEEHDTPWQPKNKLRNIFGYVIWLGIIVLITTYRN